MGIVNDVASGTWALLQGMGVTFRNMLRRPVTIQYPEERHGLPAGYRALPALTEDGAGGRLKCTGCGVCARNCPIRAISVTAMAGDDGKKTVGKYDLDMSKCMVCGLCVESCPFGGLVMYDHYELATPDKASLLYGKERLRISSLEREKQAADRRLTRSGPKRVGLRGPGPGDAGGRG